MSFSSHDYANRITGTKYDTVSSEDARLVQMCFLLCEEAVLNHSMVDSASRVASFGVFLNAVGVSTKTDLAQAGGDSFASRLLRGLPEAEQAAIKAALPG